MQRQKDFCTTIYKKNTTQNIQNNVYSAYPFYLDNVLYVLN